MIATVHLLCGRGCRMGENFEKIVSFGAFLFISGSDFVLNNFRNDHF